MPSWYFPASHFVQPVFSAFGTLPAAEKDTRVAGMEQRGACAEWSWYSCHSPQLEQFVAPAYEVI